MRNFSALTQGDIIEISYNTIVFGLLVMETHPGGEGICVIDTDLEVDFAAPVGYVEPERPKPAPQSTMASKPPAYARTSRRSAMPAPNAYAVEPARRARQTDGPNQSFMNCAPILDQTPPTA